MGDNLKRCLNACKYTQMVTMVFNRSTAKCKHLVSGIFKTVVYFFLQSLSAIISLCHYCFAN